MDWNSFCILWYKYVRYASKSVKLFLNIFIRDKQKMCPWNYSPIDTYGWSGGRSKRIHAIRNHVLNKPGVLTNLAVIQNCIVWKLNCVCDLNWQPHCFSFFFLQCKLHPNLKIGRLTYFKGFTRIAMYFNLKITFYVSKIF